MSGMAGTFATQSLNSWNMKTTAGVGFNSAGSVVDTNALASFNNTMGGIASTAVTYGMTGRASVNLLNTSMLSAFGLRDIENKAVSVGLFELGFGKGGVRGSIGMGGTNLNVGQLFSSIKGAAQTGRITGLKLGGENGNATLETIAQLGYSKNQDNIGLAAKLFSGKLGLKVTDGVTAGNESYRGAYNKDSDPATILINRMLLGNKSAEGLAELATVVSHEGSHVDGNTIESIAHQRGNDTYTELANVMGFTRNNSFVQEMQAMINDPANATSNGGGDQLWKLMNNGELIRDGQKSVYNEEGFRLMNLEEMEDDIQSLAFIMGLYKGGISDKEYKVAAWNNVTSNTEQNLNESMNSTSTFRNSMLDSNAARLLLSASGGQSVNIDFTKESELTVRNAFYNLLKNQEPAGFCEKTFNSMFSGLRKEGLGYFIDFTKFNPDEQVPTLSVPSIKPKLDTFKNTGVSGTGLYFTIGKLEDTRFSGYPEKDLPSENIYPDAKQGWQRDALYKTRKNNNWNGRVTGTGIDKSMIENQNNYSNRSFTGSTIAGSADLIADLSKATKMSLLNQTQFYQWNQNGISFFTIKQPESFFIPSVTKPVSYSEMISSPTLNSMTNWYGMDAGFSRKSIRAWNDFIGWDSWTSWKVK